LPDNVKYVQNNLRAAYIAAYNIKKMYLNQENIIKKILIDL